MIQDLSGSWCIEGTDESTLVMDSTVPLMSHDTVRSWITDPDPDHLKERTFSISVVRRVSKDGVNIIVWEPRSTVNWPMETSS